MKTKILVFIIYIFLILSFRSQVMGDECVVGNCVNGEGTYTYADGSKYRGDWKNNKFHGHGWLMLPDGADYIGEFKNDLMHGQGTLTWTDGTKYEGEFKDDLFNGQGTFMLANGSIYVGEFKDDKFNGQGTLTIENGNKYVGEFKDNKFNGQGTYTTPKGDKYVGGWKNSLMHGHGTLTEANGDKYVGGWKNSLMHGRGTYTRPNGYVFNGEFKDNKQVKAEGYKKFSYLEFECSEGATALSQGVIKVYLFFALDRNTMRKYSTTNTSLESEGPLKKTLKITSWEENKISFELDHKIKHKFYAHNPYIKNDKYYQQDQKVHGGKWFSLDCTRVKER